VLIEGDNLPYTLAACCTPHFPKPLLGYVTRGKGVTVHALGCRNVPEESQRYVTCRWEMTLDAQEHLACRLELRAADRIGLVSDIATTVAAQRFNIAGMSTLPVAGKGETVLNFGVEVPDLFALANLIRKLERISGVVSVHRIG